MADNGLYYNNTTGLDLTSGGSERIQISTGGVIKFNSSYTFPTTDGSVGQVLTTDGSGGVSFTDSENLYTGDGSLGGNRIVDQDDNNLEFRSNSNELTAIIKTVSVSPTLRPRVFFEADDSYSTVVQIKSSFIGTNQIEGYDNRGTNNFTVDHDGNLNARSKSFLIPHPTKDGFNLRHGSLEGPEHGVYVRGKLEGSKVIELPDYWLELVDESTITVQLTPIGSHQNLFVKDIIDNTVIVGNSNILSSKVKCFYLVQAERKDIDKMLVEYPQGTSSI